MMSPSSFSSATLFTSGLLLMSKLMEPLEELFRICFAAELPAFLTEPLSCQEPETGCLPIGISGWFLHIHILLESCCVIIKTCLLGRGEG